MKISEIIRLLEQDGWVLEQDGWVLKRRPDRTGTAPPHEARTGYSRREAKRYLEAEDPIQHPEAGRLVKGAA